MVVALGPAGELAVTASCVSYQLDCFWSNTVGLAAAWRIWVCRAGRESAWARGSPSWLPLYAAECSGAGTERVGMQMETPGALRAGVGLEAA